MQQGNDNAHSSQKFSSPMPPKRELRETPPQWRGWEGTSKKINKPSSTTHIREFVAKK